MSETLKATEKELNEAGITFEVVSAKRHYKVRFVVKGVKCQVVCSRTSSDHRAAVNARLEVRRRIRRALEDN